MSRLTESAIEVFGCNVQILHIAFPSTMLDTDSPLPNPLDGTTSHSTRLPKTAAKSLVIPLAGEGATALLSSGGELERGKAGTTNF